MYMCISLSLSIHIYIYIHTKSILQAQMCKMAGIDYELLEYPEQKVSGAKQRGPDPEDNSLINKVTIFLSYSF